MMPQSSAAPPAAATDPETGWGDLAARLKATRANRAPTPGQDVPMTTAGEVEDPAAKRSRVGGHAVNMVGGIECGFDGVPHMEPDGSEVQRILYAGANSDSSGLEEELNDEDVADLEAIEDDAEVGLDLIGMSTPYDQRTFLEIPRELAQEGRKTEIEKMKLHDVFEVVPVDKLRGKKIGVKLVEEVRQRDDGTAFARCRLVGKEIA